MFECGRCSGQIEQPHPVEARVVQFNDPRLLRHAAAIPFAQCQRIVTAKHFDVRHHELVRLDRLQRLAHRRDVAAGEDVLAREAVGAIGWPGAADRVQQHHAVLGQQIVALGEERAIVGDADMFEHADGNDTVEAAFLVAVVGQRKRHLVGQAFAFRPGLGIGQLFAAERDAMHVRARQLVQLDG